MAYADIYYKTIFMGKLYLGDLEITNYDAVIELSSTTTAHTADTIVHVTQALLDRITVLENKVRELDPYRCEERITALENKLCEIHPFTCHDYVEIGGLKWSTMNIGATAVTDSGLYFQWGDTKGYTANQVGSGEGQKRFDWQDYKFWTADDGSGSSGMTKYNSTGYLDVTDDAVNALWGSTWHIPTPADYGALKNSVNTVWTDNYKGSGVAGLICTDKTDASKVLFFPAFGNCSNGSVNGVGSCGSYWSNQCAKYATDIQKTPWPTFFDFDRDNVRCPGYRGFNPYLGFLVRGVYNE